ncbi:MAG: hypothetical protein R6V40_00420, partial [Candidatus Moraniibacteriota bacterium]
MSKKKKLLLSLLVIPVVAFAVQIGVFKLVKADHAYNSAIHHVTGWLWGGSEDDSISDSSIGTTDGNETGVGWGSVSSDKESGGASYQVNIPFWDCGDTGDCNVTGYAWHGGDGDDDNNPEGLGWIDFNPSGPYPSSPNHSAKREGNSDKLTGWARVVGIQQELAVGNSGGWEGWIKMSGTADDGTSYGVDLSDLENSYAWNEENSDGGLGWISFEKLVLPGVPQFQACPETPPALKV